jgi:DNA polymerase II small subunit/DNA polymerase delta subunit B
MVKINKIVLVKVPVWQGFSGFQKKVAWVPTQKRGQVIEFCSLVKKSA